MRWIPPPFSDAEADALSQRANVDQLVVHAPESLHAAIQAGQADICDAGSVAQFEIATAAEFSCSITLGEPLPSA